MDSRLSEDRNSKKKPQLLFNASTNVIGGAVQNAANFVVRAQGDQRYNWSFVVSPEVEAAARSLGAHDYGVEVMASPARSHRVRVELTERLNSNEVNLVYTMAGPAYVNVERLHVMGISNPYVTHPTWEAYLCGRSKVVAALDWLKSSYKVRWAKQADAFIFQTETARAGCLARCKVDSEKTFVVPNAFGLKDLGGALRAEIERIVAGRRIVFVPSAGYPHKALHMIPSVLEELRGLGPTNCVFVLTLDFQSEIWRRVKSKAKQLRVLDRIINIGVTPYKEMASLYRASEVVFVPSLLETFSTSYLEAMGFGKPLVVPNRRFSLEVCGGGAIYYDGTAKDAGRAIGQVLEHPGAAAQVLEDQCEVLARYGGQDDRYSGIMRVLEVMLSRDETGRS